MSVSYVYVSPLLMLAERQRQAEHAAMELTFVQIQMLPVTTDCPPEELV